MEAINDSLKLIAQAKEILINCNVHWQDEHVVTAILILEKTLEKLSNPI